MNLCEKVIDRVITYTTSRHSQQKKKQDEQAETWKSTFIADFNHLVEAYKSMPK